MGTRSQRVRFLVPWRPLTSERERLWAFCKAWWAQACPDISVVEGSSPPGPFNRSAAINEAAEGDWDVAVVLDADVVADGRQVYAAIDRAAQTGRATLGFEFYVGLNRQTTERALAGEREGWDAGARYRSSRHESSIVAVPRALWDAVGGFDEHFVGWGQEDVAFIQAARVLGGDIERVPGIVYHLWHERAPERDRRLPHYRANQRRGAAYRKARTPEAMRELLSTPPSRAEIFADIYATNGWNGVQGTRAGPGSTLQATARLREELPRLVAELGVSSVLDAACGDSLWQPELPGYVGVDVVPWAIRRSQRRHPHRNYVLADICADELPKAELVLCRDAMQHMSFADGLAALENFRRTGASWLVASSHQGSENTDVPTGGWYEINLEAEPFALGEPKWSIPDGSWARREPWPHKILGLWSLT